MKCEHLQHFAKLILQVLLWIRNVDPSHRGITHPERTQDVVVLEKNVFMCLYLIHRQNWSPTRPIVRDP
jgi:hypothetical protein